MAVRIGEILVTRGVLTLAQVNDILELQRASQKPFGDIAENQFDVHPDDIEAAWLTQYELTTERADPIADPPTPEALATISRRQAWQFRTLPLRHDGPELVVCTTPDNLSRALRFTTNVLAQPSVVVVTEPALLNAALALHFPIEGFDTDDLLAASRIAC
jgi:hypothetical protein